MSYQKVVDYLENINQELDKLQEIIYPIFDKYSDYYNDEQTYIEEILEPSEEEKKLVIDTQTKMNTLYRARIFQGELYNISQEDIKVYNDFNTNRERRLIISASLENAEATGLLNIYHCDFKLFLEVFNEWQNERNRLKLY